MAEACPRCGFTDVTGERCPRCGVFVTAFGPRCQAAPQSRARQRAQPSTAARRLPPRPPARRRPARALAADRLGVRRLASTARPRRWAVCAVTNVLLILLTARRLLLLGQDAHAPVRARRDRARGRSLRLPRHRARAAGRLRPRRGLVLAAGPAAERAAGGLRGARARCGARCSALLWMLAACS